LNLGANSFIDFAISHNREDLATAEAALAYLEAAGLVGWLDSRAFYSPLVSAERQIERAFRQARFICLLVSDRFRDSAWCREEYRLGLRSEVDLLITRVLVIAESRLASAFIPEALARAPKFVWTNEEEVRKCGEFITETRNTASHLAAWRDPQGRSELVAHLPTGERIKLVGDHMEFLFSQFASGLVDPRNHTSAVRLGLTAGLPNSNAAHLTPALAMEMCWRWTSCAAGESSLRRFLHGSYGYSVVSDLPVLEIRALFAGVLPIFRKYLETAAGRRGSPPVVTEADLLAILDYMIDGFLAVICTANQCEQDVIDPLRDLLQFVVAHGHRRISNVANYLRQGLPAISLPRLRLSRAVHIDHLLRDATS
jgi:hypothetical protein